MDRTQAPHTKIDTHIPYIKPVELVLDNGLRVYMLDGGIEDIVKLDLVFFAGSFYQSRPLVAHTVAHLMQTGTENRTSDKINETFDFYGASFGSDAQKDIASFNLIALHRHFEQVLELFQEIIKKPIFPDHELEIFLKNQRQQYLINNQRVQHVARTYFSELVFGQNHPYGYRIATGDFDKVEREDLVAFHQEYYNPGNAYCIVSGKLPPNIDDLMQVSFGGHDWPEKTKAAPPSYMAVSASEKKVMVQKTDVVQSAIRIGRRLFNRTHPDFHRLMITNTLLGGFFGSRLMQNIRQDKGYTYGIGSNLVSLLRDGYFFVGAEVGVDVCQKAIDEIYHELRNLRSVPARETDLNSLKAYLGGDFLRSFDGPFAQSQRYKELLAFQLNVAHYDAFLKELESITPMQIMQTAEKYLHEDSMTELVVGGK